MLAPIITKDMKLFGPIPPNVKNVRSRAHSLNELKYSASTPRPQQSDHSRTSQSVGNIPASSKSLMKSTSIRKPSNLDAILEGVELSSCNGRMKDDKGCRRTADRSTKSTFAKETYVDALPCTSSGSSGESSPSPATSPSERRSGGWSKSVVRRLSGVLKSKSKSVSASSY